MKLSNLLVSYMAFRLVVSTKRRSIRHIAAGGLIKTEPTDYVDYYGTMNFSDFRIAQELIRWEQSGKIIEKLELIRNGYKMLISDCHPEVTLHNGSDGILHGQLTLHIGNYNLNIHTPSWKDWFIVEEKEYATK